MFELIDDPLFTVEEATVKKGRKLNGILRDTFFDPFFIVTFPMREGMCPLRIAGHIPALAITKTDLIQVIGYFARKRQEILPNSLPLLICLIFVYDRVILIGF